jgi:hypothetical protein
MAGVLIADCLSGGVHPIPLSQNCINTPSEEATWVSCRAKSRFPKLLETLEIGETRWKPWTGFVCAQGTGIGSKGSIVFRRILTITTIWGICSSLDSQPTRPQQMEFGHSSVTALHKRGNCQRARYQVSAVSWALIFVGIDRYTRPTRGFLSGTYRSTFCRSIASRLRRSGSACRFRAIPLRGALR